MALDERNRIPEPIEGNLKMNPEERLLQLESTVRNQSATTILVLQRLIDLINDNEADLDDQLLGALGATSVLMHDLNELRAIRRDILNQMRPK